MRLHVAFGALLSVFVIGAAAAAPADRDLTACLNDKTELESQLAACTRVIKSRAPARSRAFAFASRGGLVAIHKRDFASSIADLDQAVRLEPGLATFVQLRGSVHMEAGQHDAAITNFDAALRLDPKLSGVHRFRGLAQLRKGNYPQAMADLNQALKTDLQPHDQAEILGHRGEVYGKTGERQRGLADFTRSIELNARVDQRYAERAALYLDMGEFNQALQDLGRVIEQVPTDAASRARRGKILRLRGEPERALRDLDEAIRLDPKLAQAFTERGLLRATLRRIEPAVADAREAIRLSQPARTTPVSDYEAAQALATALGEQKRFGDCVELSTRAINSVAQPRKEHWRDFNVRGICFYQTKRLDEAEA